ncbi:hypothetical protein [Aureivirga sp. CE67]|uniref:hypothetical protein n=1 Tax=Aureivirga sp. CE67 TaxID=1788983 RepID=UPI0018CAAA23|nr:hypothetical protein [Aureivirga sp. CE67]
MKRTWQFTTLFLFFSFFIFSQTSNNKIFVKEMKGINDSEKIQNALKEAYDSKKETEIIFENKEYVLRVKEESKYLMQLNNYHDLVLNFNNAKFKLDNYKKLIHIEASDRITLKNLYFDFNTLPFSQGIITSVSKDKKTIKVRTDEGYPAFQRIVNNTDIYFGLVNDKISGKHPKKDTRPFYNVSEISRINNSNASITFQNPGNIEPGDTFLFIGAKKDFKGLINIENSNSINIQNIVIYSTPFHVINIENSETNIDMLKVKTKKNRLFSASAMGIIVKNNREKVSISNSYFEALGKDVVSVEKDPLKLKKKLSENQVILKIKNTNSINLQKDDILVFYNEKSGEEIGENRISSVVKQNNTDYLITFKNNTNIKSDRKRYLNKILVYSKSQNNQGFEISNSIFENNHNNAISIYSGENLSFDNLKFKRNVKYALKFEKNINLKKGFDIENISIKNSSFNEIYSSRTGIDFAISSIIFSNPYDDKNDLINSINIEGNYFKQPCNISAITIQNTMNTNISKNKVEIAKKCSADFSYYLKYLDENNKLTQKDNNFIIE